MIKARLILLDSAADWQLTGGMYTVGRKKSCSICLEVPSVSREHARIEHKSKGWVVQDLGSSNGTLVNGVPVTAAVRLKHGDKLQFGQLELRFLSEGFDDLADGAGLGETSGVTILSRSETRPVTMLVADLEGFAAIASHMESGALADAVRCWCDDCRRILDFYEACLDKFIGDCVFAWWHHDDGELRKKALAAARAIIAIPSPPGAPPFRCGAALHCGQVALCRLPNNSHTLLGSAVNATFRMESLTRPLKQPLLVSENFANGYPRGDMVFVSCGAHQVKGISEPLNVLAPQACVP